MLWRKLSSFARYPVSSFPILAQKAKQTKNPRHEPFIPGNNSSTYKSNPFSPWKYSFGLRKYSFGLRQKTFLLWKYSFGLRKYCFLLREYSFGLRKYSFIPVNKYFFKQDKPQLSENIFPIHLPPFYEHSSTRTYSTTPRWNEFTHF